MLYFQIPKQPLSAKTAWFVLRGQSSLSYAVLVRTCKKKKNLPLNLTIFLASLLFKRCTLFLVFVMRGKGITYVFLYYISLECVQWDSSSHWCCWRVWSCTMNIKIALCSVPFDCSCRNKLFLFGLLRQHLQQPRADQIFSAFVIRRSYFMQRLPEIGSMHMMKS